MPVIVLAPKYNTNHVNLAVHFYSCDVHYHNPSVGENVLRSPVLHFEIGGKDVNELIDFYSSTFGWNIFPLNNDLYIADPASDQGIEGHLFQATDQMDYTNLVIIYVQVDDIHSSLEKSERLGGKILVQPVEIPGSVSHYAIFSDTSDNRIGLLQRRISDV